MYDKLFSTNRQVKNIIKRIRGNYYDLDNNVVDRDSVIPILLSAEKEYIIKPSDSNNGLGIEKIYVDNSNLILLNNAVSIDNIEEIYGYNFSIQKVIEQHPIMAAPHPSSVNTLRMVTLRWEKQIHYLLTFARFGANNAVKDNAGAGGVCVGLEDDGTFLNLAIDVDANSHEKHPTTNFDFNKLDRIPNFDRFKSFVVDLHHEVPHHDFISWDIAVDVDLQPVFIEANFAGATWLYQFACKRPLFGDLTDEILDKLYSVENVKKRDIQIRSLQKSQQRRRNKLALISEKLKTKDKKLKKLSKINKNLELEIRRIDNLISKQNNQLENIRNSRSWRYTKIFRKK